MENEKLRSRAWNAFWFSFYAGYLLCIKMVIKNK